MLWGIYHSWQSVVVDLPTEGLTRFRNWKINCAARPRAIQLRLVD